MATKKPARKKLNPKQELFCQLYATNRDFFGNGVESYGEAYGIDLSNPRKNAVARQQAYRLLTNSHILRRIDELMALGPLNDTTVDRELAFVIAQKAELGPKVAAIREYNALKARVTKKLDLSNSDGSLKPLVIDSTVAGKFMDAAPAPTEDSQQ